MFNDREKSNLFTIFFWLNLLCLATHKSAHSLVIQQTYKVNGSFPNYDERNAPQPNATVRNFSPRMEYNNEWHPVGRGDPLKNDPTFDYSPPTLDRVRYWRADNESKDNINIGKHLQKEYFTHGKKESYIVGAHNEPHRGQAMHSESSLLQPKFTSIRRSYYANQHQLPTHLMPPPMQTLSPNAHHMKSSTSEYPHKMPSSTTKMTVSQMKPYYSTASSSPWIHSTITSTSLIPSKSLSITPNMKHKHYHQQSHQPLNISHVPYDKEPHHQETGHYFSYAHFDMSSPLTTNSFLEPNHKQGSYPQRKAWLHELLQKERVKEPLKAGAFMYQTNFEIKQPLISTAHPPVTFVPTTNSNISPSPTALTTKHTHSTTSPNYLIPTAPTITTSSASLSNTPVMPTPNRLLIPTSSNLSPRPTVAAIEMTTDAYFRHYNQPEKPLFGPMYLIIEGHSKVKTYGKDELDPHQPKIVPIIPKREAVIRIADPNEKKRGTSDTFLVKHLHTQTTTPSSAISPVTTTTIAPKANISFEISVPKSSATNTTLPTTTSTTLKSFEAMEFPNEQYTKSTTQPPTEVQSNGMEGFFNFIDSSIGSLFRGELEQQIKQDATFKAKETIFVTTTATTTRLRPIVSTPPSVEGQKIEARTSPHDDKIDNFLGVDVPEDKKAIFTDPSLRDLRQVFDYDQQPDLSFKNHMNENINDENDENVESLTEYEDDIQFQKHVEKLVDNDNNVSSLGAEFEELISKEIDSDDDLEMPQSKKS